MNRIDAIVEMARRGYGILGDDDGTASLATHPVGQGHASNRLGTPPVPRLIGWEDWAELCERVHRLEEALYGPHRPGVRRGGANHYE